MSIDAIQELSQEVRAAQALRDTLSKMPGIDDETTRDTIEGQTNLHETIAAAAELLTDTEILLEGVTGKIDQLETRKHRYAERLAFVRAAIEQAMLIGGLKTHELPDCTLTLAARLGGVVVTDEAAIPADYWKPEDPTLDKKKIAADLKAKKAVPGAALSNGGVSLTVRRS